jgi:hypothetical protein
MLFAGAESISKSQERAQAPRAAKRRRIPSKRQHSSTKSAVRVADVAGYKQKFGRSEWKMSELHQNEEGVLLFFYRTWPSAIKIDQYSTSSASTTRPPNSEVKRVFTANCLFIKIPVKWTNN